MLTAGIFGFVLPTKKLKEMPMRKINGAVEVCWHCVLQAYQPVLTML